MGRLRREGFTISPSSTADRIGRVVAKALKVNPPSTVNDSAALIRQYLSTPEVDTGYGEVRNWVPYVPSIEMARALEKAANPYERRPGDGR